MQSYVPQFVFSSAQVVWKGAMLLGVVVGAVAVAAYVFQDKIMYIPDPDSRLPKHTSSNPARYRSPSEYSAIAGNYIGSQKEGGIAFEESFVATPDGVKIHCWLMLHPNAAELPTLIYFHGNAANMGYRLPNAAKMFTLSRVNVLMMDYRGYGESTGEPSEVGINLDADAVLEFAKSHPKLGTSRTILFGRSLGGAVAISLCKRSPKLIDALVIENTFLSISDMVDSLMPWAKPFKNLILRINWDSASKIPFLTVPILFIAADLDEIVPHAHMKKLYEMATTNAKEFYLIRGGHHNDAWEKAGAEYYHRLRSFFEVNKLSLSSTVDEGSSSVLNSVDSDEDYCKVSLGDVINCKEEEISIPSLKDSTLHRRFVTK